jgi:hypothetical protein
MPSNTTFEEFCYYWRNLSPEQKSHVIVYWYRLKPVIDRQLVEGNSVKYIDCAGSDDQMTWEYMLNTHGGGVYQGIINDTDIRKNGQMSQMKLEIPMSQYDPVLNLAELDLTHRDNVTYVSKLKAKGILTSDGRINKNPTAERAKEDIMSSSVVNRLLDAALDPNRNKPMPPADSGISTLVLEMMKQNNPNNQLATLLAVVDKLKPAETPKTDSTLEWMKLMDTQRASYEARLAEMNERLFTMATKPAPVPEKPDTLAEIEKIKAMAEVLGLSGGGGKTSWVDRLIDTVGPAIPGIVEIVQSRLAANAPQQGNPGIPRMPNDMQPSMPQPGMPPAIAAPQTGEQEMPFLDTVIAQGGDQFLTAIANGTPGWEAANAVIALQGRPVYAMIINSGVAGLIEAIKRNASFAQRLSRITTEAKLEAWLHEFVHADEYDADEIEEQPEEPTTSKKSKKEPVQ